MKKLLIVANNANWQSWDWKIAKLKAWFKPVTELAVTLTYTSYRDIPYTTYNAGDNTQGWYGVNPAWYDVHIASRARGFDMVLFVIPVRQWKEPNKARGWRSDNNPSGAWEMQIACDENEHTYQNGKDLGETFFILARHEILHVLYALAKVEDKTHYWLDQGKPEEALRELRFNELSIMQKALAAIQEEVNRIKKWVQDRLASQRRATLIDALIEVESAGDDRAIGDRHLPNKAYGCLQIRKPYVDDVNRVYSTSYKAEDCLGNRGLSIDIFNKYMEIYATERRLGQPVTDEDRARMHNGGPDGYKRDTTIPYWQKVKRLLA